MDLKIDLGFLKTLFTRNRSSLFYAALAVLLLLEFFVVKRSAGLILDLHSAPPPLLPNRSVRVDFGRYDEAAGRIDRGSEGLPLPTVDSDPFRQPAAKAKQ